MRTEHLIELLAKERDRNSTKAAKKHLAGKSSLTSVLYMGVSDEDLIRYVIPKIVAMEIAGEYSKEAVKKWISSMTALIYQLSLYVIHWTLVWMSVGWTVFHDY